MGVIIAAIAVAVPGIPFIIFCYTPAGKRWRKQNGLL